MTVSTDNYLSFGKILLYDVVGDNWLFIIIGLAIVIFICAKRNMPIQTTLISCSLWLMICVGIVYNYILYAMTIIGIGFISYYLFSKTFKRG